MIKRLDVVTRLQQLESWRFSQGLPCKTPLRIHSNQAMLLPSTQQGPKPMNHSYSQMPRLTNENKTQILTPLLEICEKRVRLDTTAVISQNSSGPLLDPGTRALDSGRQAARTLMRTGWEELKQDDRKDKRFPLPTLQSQAQSYPLFDLEGSAICDLLFELFLKGRVSPFKDSTLG